MSRAWWDSADRADAGRSAAKNWAIGGAGGGRWVTINGAHIFIKD